MTLILANAGIPMLYFHLPAMVLALVPVVGVEWIVAYRQFRIPKRKALKGVLAANCFSTLLGFPLFWLIGVLVVVAPGSYLENLIPSDAASVRKIVEVGVGAIWLGPDVSSMRIVQAGLTMLIPAFLVSVFSERWILRSAWKDLPSDVIASFSWRAHFVSYPVLAVVWLCYLAWAW
jgi:hypothetical protein